MNLERVGGALRYPVQARALRVHVGDGRGHLARREIAGEVGYEGRFAYATFGVDDQRGIHVLCRLGSVLAGIRRAGVDDRCRRDAKSRTRFTARAAFPLGGAISKVRPCPGYWRTLLLRSEEQTSALQSH